MYRFLPHHFPCVNHAFLKLDQLSVQHCGLGMLLIFLFGIFNSFFGTSCGLVTLFFLTVHLGLQLKGFDLPLQQMFGGIIYPFIHPCTDIRNTSVDLLWSCQLFIGLRLLFIYLKSSISWLFVKG